MTQSKIPYNQPPISHINGEVLLSPGALLTLAADAAWPQSCTMTSASPMTKRRGLAIVNAVLGAASKAGMAHYQIAETRLAQERGPKRFAVAQEVCSYLTPHQFTQVLNEVLETEEEGTP